MKMESQAERPEVREKEIGRGIVLKLTRNLALESAIVRRGNLVNETATDSIPLTIQSKSNRNRKPASAP